MTSSPHEDTGPGYEPVDPELVVGATELLARLEATTTWDLETWMRHAAAHEALRDRAEDVLEQADSYGDELEPEDVTHLLEMLDTLAEKLSAVEGEEILARETLTAARDECPVEAVDDELVTLALRVNPVSFYTRRANLLTLLLRQLIGNGFDGSHRLVIAPRWLATLIENRTLHTGVWVIDTIDEIPDRNVIEVANSLWEPQQHGPYRTPVDTINAARLLAA